MTMLETATFNSLDAQTNLGDIFGAIHDYKIKGIDQRLPWN